METQENPKLINPYLYEVYNFGEYDINYYAISPNKKYIVFVIKLRDYLLMEDDSDIGIIVKLFKLYDDRCTGQYLEFCADLLTFRECDNLDLIWSDMGDKLICKYNVTSDAEYKIIYFDMNNKYKKHNLYFDNKKHKLSNKIIFSSNESILVILDIKHYNLYIYSYSSEACYYQHEILKKTKANCSSMHKFTHICVTSDNKIIMILYDKTKLNNTLIAFQISDKNDKIHLLTECIIPLNKLIYESCKCMYDGNNYILFSADSDRFKRMILLYDLTTLTVIKIIDIQTLSKFNTNTSHVEWRDRELCEIYVVLHGSCKTVQSIPKLYLAGFMTKTHNLLFGPNTKNTEMQTLSQNELGDSKLWVPCNGNELIYDGYIWLKKTHVDESGILDDFYAPECMFDIFTEKIIYTAYNPLIATGFELRNNGDGVFIYNQKCSSNAIYKFTGDKLSPFKLKYKLNKDPHFVKCNDIKFIHDTDTYIICVHDNKLWYGNSLSFCEEKNTAIFTNLLQEYMPLELSNVVAKYSI